MSKKDSLKKVVAKLNKETERNNAAFKKMNAAQKRVQIAKDVLEQLRLKRLTATKCVWFGKANGEPLFSSQELAKKNKDKDLQEVFGSMKSCKACAIGGMFMCAVEKADALKVKDLLSFDNEDEFGDDVEVHQEDAFEYLERFFEFDQLELIESAFEGGAGACSYYGDASDYINNIDDPSERMALIMKNIIVNKGTFDPSVKPVPTGWTVPGYKE